MYVSLRNDGTRAIRKQKDCEHYCSGNVGSKIIKIADAIHNCWSMCKKGGDFALVYLNEKITMVESIMKSEGCNPIINAIGEEFMMMGNSYKAGGKFQSPILY